MGSWFLILALFSYNSRVIPKRLEVQKIGKVSNNTKKAVIGFRTLRKAP